MSDVTADDLLTNAARLTGGTDPNDFVGADAFVSVVRQLSDPLYLDVTGPFSDFRSARTTALRIQSELGDEAGDYFVEVRPLHFGNRYMRIVPRSSQERTRN